MISANVLKGVHELLEQRGIRLYPGEPYGDMVARTLNLSDQQSESLLEALHNGASVQEAAAAAEIDPAMTEYDILIAVARVVGVARNKSVDQPPL